MTDVSLDIVGLILSANVGSMISGIFLYNKISNLCERLKGVEVENQYEHHELEDK